MKASGFNLSFTKNGTRALLGPTILFALFFHSQHLFAGFADTTTGKVNETSDQFGGLTPDEQQYLQQAKEKTWKAFKEGRTSSASNVRSRFSGLEFHDENGDGVTDHGSTANDMEGGQDIAAIGKKGLDGKQREDLLEKARAKAGKNCVAHTVTPVPTDPETPKIVYIQRGSVDKDHGLPNGRPCENISANLVDMGAAHGDANDEHRVYELTDASKKEAGKQNSDYVRTMFHDAATYDATKLGLGVVKNVGSDKSQIQVKQGDGTTKIVNVSSDVDKLRSEASWLEEQKLAAIDRDWRSLRASRLAGLSGTSYGKDVDPALANMVWGNASDEKIAESVAYNNAANANFRVEKSTGHLVPISDIDTKCDATTVTDKAACRNEYGTIHDFASQNPDAKRNLALYQEAVEKLKQDHSPQAANQLKSIDAEKQTIADCMKNGVWCADKATVRGYVMNGLKKHNANPTQAQIDAAMKNAVEGYDENKNILKLSKSTDPGIAYTDTREYNLSKLSAASRGPLDKFAETMRSLDLSEKTDARTGSTQWKTLKDQVDYAKNAVRDTQANEKELERTHPGYKSKYLGDQFDSSKQNTYQLFMRQAGRDGTTLAGVNDGAYPTGPGLPGMLAGTREPSAAGAAAPNNQSPSAPSLPTGTPGLSSGTGPFRMN